MKYSFFRSFCPFIVLLGALLRCCEAPAHGAPPKSFLWSRRNQQHSAGFYFQPTGLCEDYPVEARTPENLKRDFHILRATGVKLLRVGIGWDTIEEQPKRQNWTFWDQLIAAAVENHITLIPYVCYTPERLAQVADDFWREPPRNIAEFGRFMANISRRYRGKVHSWEIWNEPDNPDYWRGTVSQYVQMVVAGAHGVHEGDPSAVVVLGGLAHDNTDYLAQLLEDYKLKSIVDVINIHGYNETWNNNRIEDYTQHIAEFRDVIRQHGNGQDLWMAEFGYSNFRLTDATASVGTDVFYTYEHTAAYQATALFKTHVVALATGALSLTAWYRINDLKPSQGVIGDNNNKFLGIVALDGKPKPAYYALRFYNRLFDQRVRCIDDAVKINRTPASQSVVHVFEKRNGDRIVVGWLRSTSHWDIPTPTGLMVDSRREEISLTFPSRPRVKIASFDETGNLRSPTVTVKGNRLEQIPLTGSSVFIAVLHRQ